MHLIRKAISSALLDHGLGNPFARSMPRPGGPSHGGALRLFRNRSIPPATPQSTWNASAPKRRLSCAVASPDELGAVIARYQGIDGYDWVAIPLVPYLYSVEYASDVPAKLTARRWSASVAAIAKPICRSSATGFLRGGFTHGGWTQLVGVAYERRIYAFRFAKPHRNRTTPSSSA